MKVKILDALKAIHNDTEKSLGEIKIPFYEIPLSAVLERLGYPAGTIVPEFYDALQKLEEEGLIYDESHSNGGFGRIIGTDGDISHSHGVRVRLAHVN